MRVVESTLTPEIETWADPGDYPSNAGGGPLSSYDYLAGLSGRVVCELENGDQLWLAEEMARTHALQAAQAVDGATITHATWHLEVSGATYTLTPLNVQGELSEPNDCDDYDPDDY